MLIENGDGTYTAGPLDVLCILHDETKGTFHPAFFEEAPMPGPVQDVRDLTFVRLKSKMHHTTGFPSHAEALANLTESLAARIHVPAENVWSDPKNWDGDLAQVWVVCNWRHE